MLHYTRYSGTVVALRGSGQGKGLDLHVEEAWTDMPQEPPSDMPHNKHVRAVPYLPPDLSLGGVVCGHKALMLLGQELETVVTEYALSDPSGIWLLQYA